MFSEESTRNRTMFFLFQFEKYQNGAEFGRIFRNLRSNATVIFIKIVTKPFNFVLCQSLLCQGNSSTVFFNQSRQRSHCSHTPLNTHCTKATSQVVIAHLSLALRSSAPGSFSRPLRLYSQSFYLRLFLFRSASSRRPLRFNFYATATSPLPFCHCFSASASWLLSPPLGFCLCLLASAYASQPLPFLFSLWFCILIKMGQGWSDTELEHLTRAWLYTIPDPITVINQSVARYKATMFEKISSFSPPGADSKKKETNAKFTAKPV